MEHLQNTFNDFIKTQLNPQQYDATTSTNEALLVVAGAGSGKTRVITARIVNLIINHHVNPRSIIALTFTNKAAGEMRERLTHFLGSHGTLPFVGTFHAYCLQLLRIHSNKLPFAQFTILDADDQLSLIKKILKTNSVEKQFTPSQILYQLSTLKNNLYASQVQQETGTSKLINEIYHAYEAEKAASHLFDFDDLLLQILQLFSRNQEFKTAFQRHVRHILIDEYQDTSSVQHELLRAMSLNQDGAYILDSLCAVGDEDQSIYSWRGANVTNMLRFCKDFSPVRTIKLEQNYRSVEPILHAANSLITKNKLRNPKTLWSTRSGSNRIVTMTCRSGEQEAEAIALLLKHVPSSIPPHDIAILYRTHSQSRAIEESLIYHGIAYKIVGGIRFYERKEIKDLLAYLRLIINPYDKVSFFRIMNTPARGLGKKIETDLTEWWLFNPLLDYKQLIEHIFDTPSYDVSTLHRMGLMKLLEIFESITQHSRPSDMLHDILEHTGYLAYLRETHDPHEADSKVDNVRELMKAIQLFEATALAEQTPEQLQTSLLESFLHEVSLMQEKNSNEDATTQINMMTLHAAKGLEFSLVVITGLEEGLLPSTKSLNTNNELEEERRLMYVGITRARDYLLISHAHSRTTYGQFLDQAPSRFLQELDPTIHKNINIETLRPAMIVDIFRNWLGNKPFHSSLITARTTQTAPTTTRATSRTLTPAKPVIKRVVVPAPTIIPPQSEPTGPWQKNQRVSHKKFGMGIVTDIERINETDFYVTAIFKLGKKKILSSFLEKA